MSEATLYVRMGGYDVIAAATDDLFTRLLQDPLLKDYWKGKSDDSMRKDRQLIVDYFVAAAGGPAYYTGRDMKSTHTGLGITDAEYERFLNHAAATLAHLEMPTRERDEVLDFLNGLKAEVVQPQPVAV
jgi:hemoglobin